MTTYTDSFTTETIGQTVKKLRKERGMPMSELARRVGVSRQALDSIERGKVYPKPDNLVLIFHHLGYKLTPKVNVRLTVGKDTAYEVVYILEKE